MPPATHPLKTPRRKPRGKVDRFTTLLQETPRRSTTNANADTTTTLLRANLGQFMNAEMFACEPEDFIIHYLPMCEDDEVQETLKLLKDRGILVPRLLPTEDEKVEQGTQAADSTDSGSEREAYDHVLSCFMKSPKVLKDTYESLKRQGLADAAQAVDEKSVFDKIATIDDQIRTTLAKVKGVKANEYFIRMCPDARLKGVLPGCNHRIDASMTKKRGGRLRVTDVAVPFEFKLNRTEGDAQGNAEQLLSHVNYTMNEDVRRVFVLGITVEDDRVSLWYFSRSHSMKARSFSIIENANLYVKVMIALAIATEAQLGYDPLVTHIQGNHYIYKFPADDTRSEDEYYYTLQCLSHDRTLRLTGRSTRIWKVRRVPSPTLHRRLFGTEEMVLKDVSLDAYAPTEGEIQRALFSDIDAFGETEWREHVLLKDYAESDIMDIAEALEGGKYREFFSCVEAEYVGNPGLTLCPLAWSVPDLFRLPNEPLNLYQSFRNAAPADDTESQAFGPRRQCRFLYKYVCTALHDIGTLGEFSDILKQGLTPLRLMFCAGWVHRDISTGNVLAFRTSPNDRWQVKLSDLEYAKRFPRDKDGACTDPKTGTPFFMACEVQTRQYFTRLPEEKRGRKKQGEVATPSVRSGEAQTVSHNYQHDMESFWWIFVWASSSRVNQRDLPMKFGKQYFQQSMEGIYAGGRRSLLQNPLHKNADLLLSLPTPLKSSFLSALEDLRYNIYLAYMERNGPEKADDISTYSWITGDAFTIFFETIEEFRAEWESIELVIESHLRSRDPMVRAKVLRKDSQSSFSQVLPKKRKFEEVDQEFDGKTEGVGADESEVLVEAIPVVEGTEVVGDVPEGSETSEKDERECSDDGFDSGPSKRARH
ncbi:other/FunK1 protein kinase [Coprinopsis cinerea okayama7|uniref:Other/FunK1 protein kinase n=1 Tax=Coprinopsis cinerea (strain Okayama-7 / 130 / ATCC MYA-4618 / FGSC 9003) TaxID=240176 RepID=D6RPL8_COPC7|nr:other/FunK1 protein kinase [Coprinopsis cinerea okayama7\|eukprot:XP_002910487.1 other/FunK1 protein kinase [Coprinopsis cinerea okayama7\